MALISLLAGLGDTAISIPEKVTLGGIATGVIGYVVWQNRQLHLDAREDRRAMLEVTLSVREALHGVERALERLGVRDGKE